MLRRSASIRNESGCPVIAPKPLSAPLMAFWRCSGSAAWRVICWTCRSRIALAARSCAMGRVRAA
ncbi:hypothetical protein NBEOAGPD_1059 [Methylobacterium gregans]|uniref:Uncharacterized protein n=1 Tax=Methylobacterium gregans TaxID=374424 RepID=A0AA37HMG0_9HYPH|nr:hypothetical protein NBEOAGPD_1059 [Methylobacterium gregans]